MSPDDKRDAIERIFMRLLYQAGMDRPHNHAEIVGYIYEDVCETADEEEWHDGDVSIGFRRWIESQSPE